MKKAKSIFAAFGRTLGILFAIALILGHTSIVSALSQADFNSITTDTAWYDNSNSGCSSDSSSGAAGVGSGSSVYILGDSITDLSTSAYQTAFKQQGITANIDASVSRSLNGAGLTNNKLTGMQAIALDTDQIKAAKAIVIALGTNGGDTDQSVGDALSAIKKDNGTAPIYWVDTISVGRSDGFNQKVIGPNNVAIYNNSTGAQKYQVISWFKAVDVQGNPQSPNGAEVDPNHYISNADGLGVHPTPEGVGKLVQLVTSSVASGSSVSDGTSAAGSSASCCASSAATTDPGPPTSSSDSSGASAVSTGTNKDYAGNPILTQGQLQAISENQPVYMQAAQQVGIPWQMLAVIHLRETGLKLVNPNDDGLFQYVSKSYPTGPVSQPEFLQMAVDAANLIKSNSPKLSASSTDAAAVKDSFFSYNGRAQAYITQAEQLGFSADQGYEGSPYVMNKADARRDPSVNKTTWGQIKTDGGGLSYPANSDYGAFVEFGAMTGISGGGCSGGAGGVAGKIVSIAQQELQLWVSGQLVPGSGYEKYTQGRHEDWCADFSSWVYNQAGAPLAATKDGNVPAVVGVQAAAQQAGHYHPVNGYTPKPGDIVVRLNGTEHVNIVISVTGDNMVVIGGNQGGGSGGFNSSKVSEYNDKVDNPEIAGYVSPN